MAGYTGKGLKLTSSGKIFRISGMTAGSTQGLSTRRLSAELSWLPRRSLPGTMLLCSLPSAHRTQKRAWVLLAGVHFPSSQHPHEVLLRGAISLPAAIIYSPMKI